MLLIVVLSAVPVDYRDLNHPKALPMFTLHRIQMVALIPDLVCFAVPTPPHYLDISLIHILNMRAPATLGPMAISADILEVAVTLDATSSFFHTDIDIHFT